MLSIESVLTLINPFKGGVSVEFETGVRDWSARLECEPGVRDWSTRLEFETGM